METILNKLESESKTLTSLIYRKTTKDEENLYRVLYELYSKVIEKLNECTAEMIEKHIKSKSCTIPFDFSKFSSKVISDFNVSDFHNLYIGTFSIYVYDICLDDKSIRCDIRVVEKSYGQQLTAQMLENLKDGKNMNLIGETSLE